MIHKRYTWGVLFFVFLSFTLPNASALPEYTNGFTRFLMVPGSNPHGIAGPSGIEFYNNEVHIIWQGGYNGPTDLYYTKLDLWGNTVYSGISIPSFSTSNSRDADFAIDNNGILHLVWQEESTLRTLYYISVNTSSGTVIGTPTPFATGNAFRPDIAFNHITNAVVATWTDGLNSYYQFLIPWGTPVQFPTRAADPAIAVDRSGTYYFAYRRGNDVYVRTLSANGRTWGPEQSVFANLAAVPGNFVFAVNGNVVYLAFGAVQASYFRRVDNLPSHQAVAIPLSNYPSIELNQWNTIYVSWLEGGALKYQIFSTTTTPQPLTPALTLVPPTTPSSVVLGPIQTAIDNQGNIFNLFDYGFITANKIYFTRSQCPPDPGRCSMTLDFTPATRILTFAVKDKSNANAGYKIAASFLNAPSIGTGRGTQIIPLALDTLFVISLVLPLEGSLVNGEATQSIIIPPLPAPVTIFAAFVTYPPIFSSVSPAASIRVQ